MLTELVEHGTVGLLPHPGLLPGAQPAPAGVPGTEAQLGGKLLPCDVVLGHEQDAFQGDPVIDPRPPGAPVFRRRRRWNQRFQQRPQLVAE